MSTDQPSKVEELAKRLTDDGCIGDYDMGCTADDADVPLADWCLNCLAGAVLRDLEAAESRLLSLTHPTALVLPERRIFPLLNQSLLRLECADDLARLGPAEMGDLTRTGETSKATDGAATASSNEKA